MSAPKSTTISSKDDNAAPKSRRKSTSAKEPKNPTATTSKQKKTKTKKKKTDAEPETKLLSPKAALVSLQQQDVLFGTSSQLAREDSPPFVRDLQRAIVESEKGLDEVNAVNGDGTTIKWRKSKLSEAKRNLWEAAARDHDDELLLASQKSATVQREEEHVTDCGRPAVRMNSAGNQEREAVRDGEDAVIVLNHDVRVDGRDEGHDGRNDVTKDVDTLQEPAILRAVDSLPTPENSNTSEEAESVKKMPDNDPNHDSHNMIQTNTALPQASAKSPNSKYIIGQSTPPIIIPSQTPSKESTGWTHIDEISDSEPEFTPSPPHRSTQKISSASIPPVPPLQLTRHSPAQQQQSASSTTSTSKATSTSSGITPQSATWATIAPNLFTKITTIIKSTPPSTDRYNASWHEKILMYQPVDIDALTVWLNEQGLKIPVTVRATSRKRRVETEADCADRSDGEKVSDKRKRGRPKGKKSERPDDDVEDPSGEVRIEMRELSSWMVRKWCQEFSVCGVWRDGVHGWRRK